VATAPLPRYVPFGLFARVKDNGATTFLYAIRHIFRQKNKTRSMMKFPRASGILLHPTSLLGRSGTGDLGPEAHSFVEFSQESGQAYWQILALGPTG